MSVLNYLKGIVAGVGAGVLWPLVDYLWGLIPGLPIEPHTALDILTCALLTGGATIAVSNRNQPVLQTGQVVVDQHDVKPEAEIVAAHKP